MSRSIVNLEQVFFIRLATTRLVSTVPKDEIDLKKKKSLVQQIS